MRPSNLTALKKMDQKPHTIDDSIAVQANGLRNFSQLRETFPDAYLEEVFGLGRVWVSESVADKITDFECVPDANGISSFVPCAEAGTIRVYLPSTHEKSRSYVNGMKAQTPELHQQIVEFLKAKG